MAGTLQCPIPENINPLSNVGFLFSIERLPELTYFGQVINLPAVTLPEFKQSTPFSDPSIPGDKLVYDNLTFQFLIDEDMKNYKAVFNWIEGLGFPVDNEQYNAILNEINRPSATELSKNYSDATLAILNSSNNPIAAIKFIDIHPISLTTNQEFNSTVTTTQYLQGIVTFAYSYYTFE